MSADNNTAPVVYRELARYHGYRFGDDGSVWSRWTWTPHLNGWLQPGYTLGEWRPLSGRPNGKGYLRVSLKNAETGRIDDCYVHRVVMEAFRGPCPDGKEVRHVDDNDRSNNRLPNLGYATHLENIRDKFRHGTQTFGVAHHTTKLNWAKVRIIRKARKRGVTVKRLMAVLGLSRKTISNVASGRCWTTSQATHAYGP